MTRGCAVARPRELDTSDLARQKNIDSVEFTASATGKSTREHAVGMGAQPG